VYESARPAKRIEPHWDAPLTPGERKTAKPDNPEKSGIAYLPQNENS
jgi:hypothetical protein